MPPRFHKTIGSVVVFVTLLVVKWKLELLSFPLQTRQDLKETRQELLEDVKDIIGGRDNSQALERLAEHPEFEDPFQCWKVGEPRASFVCLVKRKSQQDEL